MTPQEEIARLKTENTQLEAKNARQSQTIMACFRSVDEYLKDRSTCLQDSITQICQEAKDLREEKDKQAATIVESHSRLDTEYPEHASMLLPDRIKKVCGELVDARKVLKFHCTALDINHKILDEVMNLQGPLDARVRLIVNRLQAIDKVANDYLPDKVKSLATIDKVNQLGLRHTEELKKISELVTRYGYTDKTLYGNVKCLYRSRKSWRSECLIWRKRLAEYSTINSLLQGTPGSTLEARIEWLLNIARTVKEIHQLTKEDK